jgi:hypothetical protein
MAAVDADGADANAGIAFGQSDQRLWPSGWVRRTFGGMQPPGPAVSEAAPGPCFRSPVPNTHDGSPRSGLQY